jgi:hypothetical protein
MILDQRRFPNSASPSLHTMPIPYSEASHESSDTGKEFRLPTDRQTWSVPAGTRGLDEEYMKALDVVARSWKFLALSFVAHGYYLYEGPLALYTNPAKDGPLPSTLEPVYPYSRRADGVTDPDDFQFIYTQVRQMSTLGGGDADMEHRGFVSGLRGTSWGEKS